MSKNTVHRIGSGSSIGYTDIVIPSGKEADFGTFKGDASRKVSYTTASTTFSASGAGWHDVSGLSINVTPEVVTDITLMASLAVSTSGAGDTVTGRILLDASPTETFETTVEVALKKKLLHWNETFDSVTASVHTIKVQVSVTAGTVYAYQRFVGTLEWRR